MRQGSSISFIAARQFKAKHFSAFLQTEFPVEHFQKGIILSQDVNSYLELQLNWIILILSFFLTFIVNTIFGLYPAYKASKMNPVNILRDI